MAPGTRFLLVGLTVALGEAALATALLPASIAAYLYACAGASALLAVAARRLFDPPAGGGGGRGPAGDEPPPWWPEFEAALRRYERARDRTPTPTG